MGDINAVEAQYVAYHPYANMQKVEQTPSKDASESIKKMMNEYQKENLKLSHLDVVKFYVINVDLFILMIVHFKLIKMLIRIRT